MTLSWRLKRHSRFEINRGDLVYEIERGPYVAMTIEVDTKNNYVLISGKTKWVRIENLIPCEELASFDRDQKLYYMLYLRQQHLTYDLDDLFEKTADLKYNAAQKKGIFDVIIKKKKQLHNISAKMNHLFQVLYNRGSMPKYLTTW